MLSKGCCSVTLWSYIYSCHHSLAPAAALAPATSTIADRIREEPMAIGWFTRGAKKTCDEASESTSLDREACQLGTAHPAHLEPTCPDILVLQFLPTWHPE